MKKRMGFVSNSSSSSFILGDQHSGNLRDNEGSTFRKLLKQEQKGHPIKWSPGANKELYEKWKNLRAVGKHDEARELLLTLKGGRHKLEPWYGQLIRDWLNRSLRDEHVPSEMADLKKIIAAGETEYVEFVEEEKMDEEYTAGLMASFANTKGGLLIWGVNHKTLKYKQFDKPDGFEQKLSEAAKYICYPEVIFYKNYPNADNENYIVVSIPEGQKKPYEASDKVYVRDGGSTRPAKMGEKKALYKKGETGHQFVINANRLSGILYKGEWREMKSKAHMAVIAALAENIGEIVPYPTIKERVSEYMGWKGEPDLKAFKKNLKTDISGIRTFFKNLTGRNPIENLRLDGYALRLDDAGFVRKET